jgi:Phosphotransferase enzyme family
MEAPSRERRPAEQLIVQRSIRDESLPAARDLLGPRGLELAADVASEAGSVLSIRPRQALYAPGDSLLVNYHARVAASDGREREEVVAAVADRGGLPEGAPVRTLRHGPVAVWRFPNDPVLGCLETVLDKRSLSEMLGYLHLEPRTVTVNTLVYRPMRRAVVRLSLKGDRFVFDRAAGRIEVRRGGRDIYLKVVRPKRAAEIGQVHDELSRHLPIPRCYGAWSDLGLLALEGLPGQTLREVIRRGSGTPPPPEELIELLERLPAIPAVDRARVRSIRRRVRSHERLLRTVIPEHEERVRRLGRRLRALPAKRLAVVHGDFYDSQVMVDEAGHISGLLDLDGVGWGNPVDDLASMLGRIWVSGQTEGRGQERFAAYAGELFEAFSRRVDPRDLCLRVAAIVFGRSTGPFRAQVEGWREDAIERIELAERCLTHADRGALPA